MSVPERDDERARLARLLRERSERAGYPLSYPQRRLWFLDQLQPDSAVYTIPLGYRIRGPLDVPALERAIDGLVRRHEVLRTAYRTVDGEPRQVVLPHTPQPLPVTDLRTHPDPRGEAGRIAAAEARLPFDLSSGVVLRPALLRIADDDYRLLLTVHHIACDAATVEVLTAQIGEEYAGHTPAEAALQYADFAEWQVAHLRGPAFDDLLGFWRDRLGARPAPSAVPADLPRPAVQTFRGAHVSLVLPPEPVAALETLAREEGATLYTALLAVFAMLLERHTGEGEAVIGTPVANRGRDELASLAGFFANTLVLRLPVPDRASFRQLLRRVRDEVRDGLAHQDLPFERLVEELHPDRDLAHHPLFGVLFSYREDRPDPLILPGCEVTEEPGDTGTAKFDLTVSVTRTAGAVRVRLEYSTDLYLPDTAARLAGRFVTAVRAAADAPDRPVAEATILGEDEARAVAAASAGPDGPDGPRPPLHELVAGHARTGPDRAAIVHRGRTITFRQLDAAVRRLADRLRAAGTGPDTPVGVYLDRTPDLLIALLGIGRAGGAYLPLDPDYPAGRLAFMIADSGAPLILTSRALVAATAGLGAPVLTVDDPGETPAPPPASADEPAVSPDHLAYVIYTSGSTGRPKGVMVTHRNLAAFGAGADRLLPAGDLPATWYAVTSFSFDISVLELLWTLSRGHTVVLHADPATAPVPAVRAPGFSLFYFGNDTDDGPGERYRLLLDGARFADDHGFTAVWTPERHFHPFGGLFPNPSVTGAAVAAVTRSVAIRAGSVVLPLQDPVRVAEEWAVVDNISGGRAGVSFASGWHANDFALAPDRYADRKRVMLDGIAEVRRLWRGETVRRRGGTGAETDLASYPRPVQPELPIWITSARHPDTFRTAGEIGAGLLTHLLGHTAGQLAEKIGIYRTAWREHGHPGDGHVTLMLHTFVGTDPDEIRETVREPLSAYLRTSIDLMAGLAGITDRRVDPLTTAPEELDGLVALAFDRFYASAGLLGTPEHCADLAVRLAGLGVDEIACLVDFGVPADAALAALPLLARVRDLTRERIAASGEPVTSGILRSGATHLQCTPSLAGALIAEPDAPKALGGLTAMLVGGEPLPPDLAEHLAGMSGGEVHNMYGPTEATIWATSLRVTPGGTVTIGRPMAGVRAHVTDRRMRPVPIGVPGELLLGGPGIARGYLGRPGLTAERFVPDPFGSGGRLYRTGDLARLRADGELEFLGRLDDQVKLRGHRIEPGEIEAVLVRHPAVRAAVATVHGTGPAARIIGYCLAPPGTSEDELRIWCARTLPDYMVPAAFVFPGAFPLTPNGKVDRRALPEPGRSGADARAAFAPPETTVQQLIAGTWAEVLRVDRVGLNDNFFDLGGNSLLLLGVRARLLDRLDRTPSLVDLFRYPTVAALAAALADGAAGRGAADARAAALEQAGRRRAGLTRAGEARRRAGGA
ncbi:natural product biosynthesis luciferase-like monooxygenase protein [Catenuloplanes nepalensis]|uniref:Natural product biosynthesis luciferase-like monooxygenase protein n=1 Tax=Catenuloplanes nepalensis TaxID=587533 RepID=A0ABT9MQU1_9ACTN|nr:MupA/Atu3671 family FMN-dependent luciferase-like monooxygenase [Catenuloplanes nepalensis]MDP9793792.1 natural product biosynthesis luciferase-like monooxygenase protein [Catenuloplanes nepalensis]